MNRLHKWPYCAYRAFIFFIYCTHLCAEILDALPTRQAFDQYVQKNDCEDIQLQVQEEALITDEQDYVKLAEQFKQEGNFQQAIINYKKAYKLNQATINYPLALGNLFYNNGNREKALKWYLRARALDQKNYSLEYNIGLCLKQKNQLNSALEHFKNAISIKSDYSEAYFQIGLLLSKQGKMAEAREYLILAQKNGNNPDISRELGILYRDTNQFDQALEAFKSAYTQEPTNTRSIMELANTLCMVGKYEQALEYYYKALELDERMLSALLNVGYIVKHQGYIQQAIEIFKKIIELNPDEPKAHFNLGLALLTIGKWPEGWQEYEWRFLAYKEKKPQYGKAPYWDGSSLDQKKILIICEQGLGDTFQFIRFAQILKEQGAFVIVMAQKPVKQILQQGCPYIDLVVTADDTVAYFDYQIPLMSIPHILTIDINSCPATIPYMGADQKLINEWQAKFDKSKFNIGLCFQGNAAYRNYFLKQAVSAKSMPATAFAPLAVIPNCAWYSLQKIDGTEQIAELNKHIAVTDFGSDLDEQHGRFMDTAAIMTHLDLIITVDTSIAHLAAALGRPVVLLLPHICDWRWMQERSDSPWYPNMTLVRQKKIKIGQN